jgi:hypothetical protein
MCIRRQPTSVIRFKRNGARQQLLCPCCAVRGKGQQAEQVQALPMLGVDVKDRAIHLLGAWVLTATMRLAGRAEALLVSGRVRQRGRVLQPWLLVTLFAAHGGQPSGRW